jgi:hypothetical protein
MATTYDPIRAWLATVAVTSLDAEEAMSAQRLLGLRIRELTERTAASEVLTPPPTGPTLPPHRTLPKGPWKGSQQEIPQKKHHPGSDTGQEFREAMGHPGGEKEPRFGFIPPLSGPRSLNLGTHLGFTKKGKCFRIPAGGVPNHLKTARLQEVVVLKENMGKRAPEMRVQAWSREGVHLSGQGKLPRFGIIP